MAIERREEITNELRQRVLAGLHLGIVRRGDRLPSVREVGSEFGADPRVALAAYRSLETEGLVERRVRSGMFVARSAGVQLPPDPMDWVVQVAASAMERGITAPALARTVATALDASSLRAFIIADTNDVLFATTNETMRDYGVVAHPLDIRDPNALATLRSHHGVPDFLVTTSYCAREAKRISSTLKRPLCIVTICCDLYKAVEVLLHDQEVYFVVDDDALGKRLHDIFAGNAYRKRLKIVVHGRDDVDSIPDTAPVYITQLARLRLGSHSITERSLPEARVFSPESSRDILSCIVRRRLKE